MKSVRLPPILLLATALVLGACSRHEAPAAKTAEVAVLVATPQDLPLRHKLVGRLAPTRVAEVRARVAGIVLERAYKEGSDVKAGQLLFRIDPKPLKAALDVQQATLAQARVNARNADATAKRYRELAAKGVVSTQDLDDANAKAASANAAVAQAAAAVESARLNLSYADVTAPIAGRAGRAAVTEGALVGQGDATLLTTVEQIDPIYANFSQPMEVVEQLRKEQAQGTLEMQRPEQMQVSLTLPDGSRYDHTGTLDFSDMAVDPDTGAVSLRAVLPNATHRLFPGMFVNITLTMGTLHNIYALPQQAIQRDSEGAYVLVVGGDDKVQRKAVTLRGMHGEDWIVSGGLNAGDRVVVSGIQSARPGGAVHAVAWTPRGSDAAAGASAAAASK
jgi:membrane fusion protein (multidrug efflux system)